MSGSNGSLFAQDTARKQERGSGWIQAHCDGGARGNPGPSGYGAVIATEDGVPLAQLSEFLGIRTNNFAEYSGLLGVLRWTLDNGYTRLRVVSDSELMVKQIQGKYKVNSPDLKPMHAEARTMIRELDAFEISHALRHKNKQADKLANDAMDRGMKRPANAASLPATPYPQKSAAPPAPRSVDPAAAMPRPQPSQPQMIRGYVKGGVVHPLGDGTLPDGIFVKIIRE